MLTLFLTGWNHLVRLCVVDLVPDIDTGGIVHDALPNRQEQFGEVV